MKALAFCLFVLTTSVNAQDTLKIEQRQPLNKFRAGLIVVGVGAGLASFDMYTEPSGDLVTPGDGRTPIITMIGCGVATIGWWMILDSKRDPDVRRWKRKRK